MEGRANEDDRRVAAEAITQLRSSGAQGIIPGCTELPLLLGDHMNASDIFNPLTVLAEAAVKHCLA